ncbi:hypothetical protein HUJ05_000325 [Dendroctonus ponderosae]|nr:hypothetical protein HUJ05_000325 [Dendroctonus ponderosae]
MEKKQRNPRRTKNDFSLCSTVKRAKTCEDRSKDTKKQPVKAQRFEKVQNLSRKFTYYKRFAPLVRPVETSV